MRKESARAANEVLERSRRVRRRRVGGREEEGEGGGAESPSHRPAQSVAMTASRLRDGSQWLGVVSERAGVGLWMGPDEEAGGRRAAGWTVGLTVEVTPHDYHASRSAGVVDGWQALPPDPDGTVERTGGWEGEGAER